MNAESELKALEDEIKALKASYPVAASKMQFAVQTSPIFRVTGQKTVRIKFTPDYGHGKTSFMTLCAIVTVEGKPTGPTPQINEPQNGNGEVVVRAQFEPYSSSTTYEVQVIASGPSAGTFSVV